MHINVSWDFVLFTKPHYCPSELTILLYALRKKNKTFLAKVNTIKHRTLPAPEKVIFNKQSFNITKHVMKTSWTWMEL